MSDEPEVTPPHVTEMHVDIYLDGFTSGVASALETIFGKHHPEVERSARYFVASLRANRKAMHLVHQEIFERMTGTDTPKPVVWIQGLGPQAN